VQSSQIRVTQSCGWGWNRRGQTLAGMLQKACSDEHATNAATPAARLTRLRTSAPGTFGSPGVEMPDLTAEMMDSGG